MHMDAGLAKIANASEGSYFPTQPFGGSLNLQPCWRTPFSEFSDPLEASEDPAVVKAADEIALLLDDLAMGPTGSLTVRLMRCLRLTMQTENLHIAYLLSALGCCLNGLHRHAEAETVHRRALCIGTKVLGMDDPNLVNSIEWLAFSLFRQGNFKEAVLLCYTMTVLVQCSVGHSHPDMANCLFNLATVVDAMGLGYHAADLRWKGQAMMNVLYRAQSTEIFDGLVGGWDTFHTWYSGAPEFEGGCHDEPYWVLAPHYSDKVPDQYGLESLEMPNFWYNYGEDGFVGSGGSDDSSSTIDVQFGTHCPDDILGADREHGIAFLGEPTTGA